VSVNKTPAVSKLDVRMGARSKIRASHDVRRRPGVVPESRLRFAGFVALPVVVRAKRNCNNAPLLQGLQPPTQRMARNLPHSG
jgi:hypothetical protein